MAFRLSGCTMAAPAAFAIALYSAAMKVAVVKETFPGERRVALVPADVAKLVKSGLSVILEPARARPPVFRTRRMRTKGPNSPPTAQARFPPISCCKSAASARICRLAATICRCCAAARFVIGLCDPLGEPQAVAELRQTGATLFALELIPRTTRAQAMDVLSSMTTLAGYRAVLLAAVELPKIFPLMMTAAGTLTAARVFVIGAGVAGLSAIATAKRLGAVVRAYDVRPACREQVESLGAKFVELPLETQAGRRRPAATPRFRTKRFISGSGS